jgi:hypothetical protein
MANDLLIQPLDLAEFTPSPTEVDPGFLSLFNDTVGNVGAPDDGFEEVQAELQAIVDSLDNALSLLSGQEGGTLDEAFVEILQLDPTGPDENLADYTSTLPAIGANVDALGAVLAGAVNPTPQPACNVTGSLPTVQPFEGVTVQAFGVRNTEAAAWNVTAVKLTGGDPGFVSVDALLPQNVAPGDLFVCSLALSGMHQGSFNAVLELTSEERAGTWKICLSYTVGTAPPGGGGCGDCPVCVPLFWHGVQVFLCP